MTSVSSCFYCRHCQFKGRSLCELLPASLPSGGSGAGPTGSHSCGPRAPPPRPVAAGPSLVDVRGPAFPMCFPAPCAWAPCRLELLRRETSAGLQGRACGACPVLQNQPLSARFRPVLQRRPGKTSEDPLVLLGASFMTSTASRLGLRRDC